MTLFMTSCGGKKSSRNCGRIRDTTRASLGKPFRILQTGNPTRAKDVGLFNWKKKKKGGRGHSLLFQMLFNLNIRIIGDLLHKINAANFIAYDIHIIFKIQRKAILVQWKQCFCAYLSKSTETLSMATMMDSLSGAWGSEWVGRLAGLAFSLPEEKPTWPAVTPTASATAESTWPLTPVTSEPDVSTAERTTRGWMESRGGTS